MSKVRVLVGTRKGAFVLAADGTRERWEISGPHFAGWEIYHLKGSPVDPNRLYASQSTGWFGQLIQRSSDGGKTWEPVGNKFVYDGVPGTHQWYDGTPHPWEFKRVWHLEPSLTDPETVYAGVEDAALFRSIDGGQTWQELSGLRGHGSGPRWQPGAGGMCLHTIVFDPSDPQRIFIAISAAGAFRTDDAGQTWRPINRGLTSQHIPEPNAEVGHCVHRIAMHRVTPGRAVHAEALGRHAQRQCGRFVARGQRQPANRLRLCHRRSRARAGDHLRRTDQERLGALSARRQASRLSQPDRGKRVGGAHKRSAAARLLRQRAARRDGRRLARSVRRVFRHHRRAGLRIRRCRRQLGSDRPGSSRRAFCRSPNTAMIRVLLPPHLRTLARVDGEVNLEIDGQATQRSVLDALEARYPMLRGTIRDHVTQERRPFLRFFACEQDLSDELAGCPPARRGRDGSRTSSGHWGHCRRLAPVPLPNRPHPRKEKRHPNNITKGGEHLKIQRRIFM